MVSRKVLALISAFIPVVFFRLREAMHGALAVMWQCGLYMDGRILRAPLKYQAPLGAEDARHTSSERLADLDPQGAKILERSFVNCLSLCSSFATSWHIRCNCGFAPAARRNSCRAVRAAPVTPLQL